MRFEPTTQAMLKLTVWVTASRRNRYPLGQKISSRKSSAGYELHLVFMSWQQFSLR